MFQTEWKVLSFQIKKKYSKTSSLVTQMYPELRIVFHKKFQESKKKIGMNNERNTRLEKRASVWFQPTKGPGRARIFVGCLDPRQASSSQDS